ncbi:hypothetical protein RO575_07795 [Methylomonas sp. MO1]|uniref:DUF7230 family protein n=1 Tax=unclassified Methylomonas TaxID=2608980 RepID=UPI000364D037|nr:MULTISPECIES: hypothetical protein [unclassified Methylomonas]MDT4289458.1 hypothetical protein [Methylomonas sp. MO1]
MRKQNPSKDLQAKPCKNPVAKFAHQFNKAQIFADKTRYRRKAKHAGLEPFVIVAYSAITKGSRPVAIASVNKQSRALAA